MTYIAPTLSPEEVSYFDTLLRRLNQTYANTQTQGLYQMGQLQQKQGVDLEALNRGFDQQRSKLPGGYAKRGLLNSGIYQQGLGDYAYNRQSGVDNLNRSYQNQLGGLNLNQFNSENDYLSGVSDVEANRIARRQAVAASLRQAR